MRGTRLTGVFCAVLTGLAIACPAASAVGGPADWMYEPTTFTEVHLQLPPASIAALEVEPKEYVEGEFSLAETDGTPGTAGPFSTPLKVGIELKGNLGSLRSVNQKAAFKIKFDKFVKGQRFLGLEKMTLNNMVQDPSMVHETTTYQAFHAMGVPAPHTGFAYLTVNGKSYGMHLNIETQDAQSLENQFGVPFASPQHLYEGEYGADVSNELIEGSSKKKWEAIEVSEGSKKEKHDLEALLAAAEAPSPGFAERLAPVADLTEMTKDWLVEKYVGNWDGYAGQAIDSHHPNNYYLYSNAAGIFQMMPWGTDQTWQPAWHLNFDDDGGVLFQDCLVDTAGCRASYLTAGREALTRLDATDVDTVARCAAAALLPWQELEARTSEQEKLPDPALDGEENLERAAEEVVATRAFIAARPRELAEFLGEPTPPPQTTEPPCPPLRTIPEQEPQTPAPGGGSPGGGTSAAGTPSTPPPLFAWARGARGAQTSGSVAVRLRTPGPGRVVLHGAYGKAKATACRGSAAVAAAGEVTIACDLTGRFASLLERHWRRIRLGARFLSATGQIEAIARPLELRRWPTHPSSS